MTESMKIPGFFIFFCFFLLTFLLSSGSPASVGDETQDHAQVNHGKEKPSLAGTARDAISLLRESHTKSWLKIKTLFNKIQMQFFPPDLEGSNEAKAEEDERSRDMAKEKMKAAAKRSFEASKVAVEGSAKSAAEEVGKAVHKTADKVKDGMPDTEESKSEL